MVTIRYVNKITGNLESLFVARNLLADVLSALINAGCTIQDIEN